MMFNTPVLADFFMPEAASTVAQSVDDVYYFILYLSLIFFVGIVGTMVYFAFKYKKGQKLVIGVCECCNSRNILRAVCKCKNVKYCND